MAQPVNKRLKGLSERMVQLLERLKSFCERMAQPFELVVNSK